MFDQLPAMAPPAWLSNIEDASLRGAFPLEGVLQSSLYYPAAEFDGDPVAYLAGNFLSFIYVDYSVGREDLLRELRTKGFRGYEVIFQRPVTREELTPNGWTPTLPSREDGNPLSHQSWFKRPFCEWMVFQRSPDLGDDHGPRRFSLLYLCADGVAAAQALYVSNRMRPAAVAIIQPGHGFGGNWTDFRDVNGPLARAILGNPAGKPEFLLYGGAGGKSNYQKTCWPEYGKALGFLGNTSIGVWRRASRTA